MHWPVAFEHTNETLTPIDPVTKRFRIADVPVSATWAALEKLVHAGKIRSIGVSNFTIAKTEELLQTAKIPPAVNQIEAHPYLQQPNLFRYLKEKVYYLAIGKWKCSVDSHRTSFPWRIVRWAITSTMLLGMTLFYLFI